MNLEEIWRIREEDIYPSLFGQSTRGIFPLTQDLFLTRFGQEDIDPRWLSLGVFEFAPTADRRSWLYVTSGHSNPWDQDPGTYDPNGESGAGVEFTFEVSEQGDWAIITLQSMLAFDLLLGAGRFPGRDTLGLHDRIPLRAPVNGRADCLIQNLVVVEPEGRPQEFNLPSGEVILAGFTGITDSERSFAQATGTTELLERLRAAGAHPITNPHRNAVV